MTTVLSDISLPPGLAEKDVKANFHEILAAERPRLIRLCAAIIRNAEAAEDVAQETLLEAWRSVDKLHDPNALCPWLSGIARNVCARWLRRQGKQAFSVDTPSMPQGSFDLEQRAADFDLEVELERDELALLLDRALALLPPSTRHILVQKFVADLPYAAIAEQLELSENAVAVRVHRGKLALKKLLHTDLRAEAETFGLISADDVWRQTRIWCTQCGQRRMVGRLDAEEFALRCPTCNIEENSYHSQDNVSDFGTLKTFRPALNRLIQQMRTIFTQAIQTGGTPCRCCGEWLLLRKGMPHYAPPSIRQKRGLHLCCSRCGYGSYISIDGLALYDQIGRNFWRREQRIRTLPQVEIEVDGVTALRIPFKSIKSGATLDMIVRRDTYELLATYSSKAS